MTTQQPPKVTCARYYPNAHTAYASIEERGMKAVYLDEDTGTVAFGDREDLRPGRWIELSERELAEYAALAVLPEGLRDHVTVQMMALHLEIEQNIPEGLSPEGEQMARALAYAVRGIPTDEEQRSRWDRRGL